MTVPIDPREAHARAQMARGEVNGRIAGFCQHLSGEELDHLHREITAYGEAMRDAGAAALRGPSGFEAGRAHEAREASIERAQLGARHQRAVERAEHAEAQLAALRGQSEKLTPTEQQTLILALGYFCNTGSAPMRREDHLERARTLLHRLLDNHVRVEIELAALSLETLVPQDDDDKKLRLEGWAPEDEISRATFQPVPPSADPSPSLVVEVPSAPIRQRVLETGRDWATAASPDA